MKNTLKAIGIVLAAIAALAVLAGLGLVLALLADSHPRFAGTLLGLAMFAFVVVLVKIDLDAMDHCDEINQRTGGQS